MAWTAIKALHHRLDASVDYILDKEKTILYSAIGYALNRDKTEQTCFESAHRCRLRSAYDDMLETKRLYGKLDGIQGYHLVQSFAEGEVTPELAHRIGKEFVERLLGNEYEAVISTHLNTENYHNHIVFNSVSLTTGKKYRSNAKSYYTTIRQISDELCKKYNLSIIYPEERGNSKSYAEWDAEQKGIPTYRGTLRKDMDDILKRCFTFRQFIDELWEMGYEVKDQGKYIAVKPPLGERFIRLKSLGDRYTEEAIRSRIIERMPTDEDLMSPTILESRYFYVQHKPKPVTKLTGWRALYFHYLYRMGVIRPRRKLTREEYLYRQQEIRKLDRRIEAYNYISKRNITNVTELNVYRDKAKEQEHTLYLERKQLYRDDGATAEQLQELNAKLKAARAEIKLCDTIETHSQELVARRRYLQEQERKLRAEKAAYSCNRVARHGRERER
ncbi:relaxase/mobilization nuclease domain-containing protein [Eubacteriales bacterium OttesenSCG-928-K08]|nr:relaxase/mobilization nuclease domain-containing protein [Eubacteriales bacterium OttesenSCG-928-K08]